MLCPNCNTVLSRAVVSNVILPVRAGTPRAGFCGPGSVYPLGPLGAGGPHGPGSPCGPPPPGGPWPPGGPGRPGGPRLGFPGGPGGPPTPGGPPPLDGPGGPGGPLYPGSPGGLGGPCDYFLSSSLDGDNLGIDLLGNHVHNFCP